jgi:hypothetical protein
LWKARSSERSGRTGSLGLPRRTSISAFVSPRIRTAISIRFASCRRGRPRRRSPSPLLPRLPSPRRRLPPALRPRRWLRRSPHLLHRRLPSSRQSKATFGRPRLLRVGIWKRTGAAVSWLSARSGTRSGEVRWGLAQRCKSPCSRRGRSGARSSPWSAVPVTGSRRSTRGVRALVGPGRCFPLSSLPPRV